MKLNEIIKLSSLCGLAKLDHEGEVLVVAYADYMESTYEYGTIVGKGKNENEALRHAIVNLTRNLEKLSNEIEEFRENMNKLMVCSDPLNFDENPIISIEGSDIIDDYQNSIMYDKPNGKFHNADLFFYEGKVSLGLR